MGPAFLLLPLLTLSVRAGPMKTGSGVSANITEFNGCMVDNVEYKSGEEVASLGPCERCVCQGSEVMCSMIKCQPNSGCRIIQQSGQCCPEYKCDCEYNGKTYNNGERLDKPEDPCQVCYCKGGEVMCTSITCYERDDCTPHFVPGQCCPRYDHCPVEGSRVSVNSVRSVNASLYSPKREMQPWPLTKPSSMPSSASFDESNGSHNNVFPQTIKIVEILPTTQGYANKPSEVSVIPRLKSNDQNDAMNREMESIESTTSSAVESLDSSTAFGSSTSEIEHLLDTTPESYSKTGEQKISATPERTVSTINPLSEDIHSTSGPDGQPDSQKFATIYPKYYHTASELSNLEEGTTEESATIPEGSGYELLTGGLYEEYSSESSLSSGMETEIYSEVTTALNEEVSNMTQNSTSDTFTITESYTTAGNFSNNVTPQTNETSSEIDSLNSSTEVKLRFAPLQNSSELTSNESDSEESGESEETSNSTPADQYSTTPLGSSEVYLSTSKYETENENSSDSSTITTEQPSELDSTSEYSITSPLANSNLSDKKSYNETSSMNFIVEGNETTTQLGEGSEINESTTEFDFTARISKEEFVKAQPRKKTIRDVGSVSSPPLTFPSVLNVHSLDYNPMSTQTESIESENITSMAKVGIYHPSKPNELAGYLTVVDDKTNATTSGAKVVSSQILLTPNDLKKLAEILIHEKIKPAYSDRRNTNKKTGGFETATSVPNEQSWEESFSKISKEPQRNNDKSVTRESLHEVPSHFLVTSSRNKEVDEEKSSSLEQGDEQSDHHSSIFEDELVRKFVSSTLPSSKYAEEDPNTSRQVRVREEGGTQYSTLLDDRDLLLLENFFRKNMGLQ